MNKILYVLLLPILILACARTTQNNDPIPIYDSLTIFSKSVNEERVINIWTPPNYNQSDESFPVLYMPDGGIKEDFPHIANTIAELVNNNRIPPIILVGIENTVRGRDLSGLSEVEEDAKYCPLSDGAKNFRAFITEELMYEINKKYRTTDEKGIIGESLAGLFVMETFFLKPNTFDFYIAMDPSLWWNNHYLERMSNEFLKEFPDKKIKLWFAGSGAEDISIHTNNVAETLQNNQPSKLIWKYSDESNEKHNTIFRATKEKALTWAINKN
ncbi:alpha/beta hydrolase [Psychroserpens sp.]